MRIKKYFTTDGHFCTFIKAEKEFLAREKNLVKKRANEESYYFNYIRWILFLILPGQMGLNFGYWILSTYK